VCRHLAYLGPAVPLADLVLTPPHSLLHQTWAPTDMRGGGTVNADGFGITWYPLRPPKASQGDVTSADATVVRYRRSVPMWADESFPGIARVTRAEAVLAAVRNGTTGMPYGEAAVAPFVDGRWSFSHNGVVSGWPDSVAKVAEVLPVTELLTLDAPTDSALVWALLRHRLRAGEPVADATAAVVTELGRVAPDSRLNLLLTDGEQIVATAWWHSLWVHHAADAVVVASEPWDPDDETWQPVPDRHLVLATRETLDVYPMEGTL
jgi:gamma-glutamyl hercynylcysteine S-oxide hydrolase